MPRYFFDIKDGHRLIDPAGVDCQDDDDATAKAKVIATAVSLDKPEADPKRHIAVINDEGQEVSRVPVSPEPSDNSI